MENFIPGASTQDEDDRIVNDLESLETSRPLSAISRLPTFRSTSSLNSLSAGEHDPLSSYAPPVNLQTLKMIDKQVQPPPAEVVHELYFDGKTPLKDTVPFLESSEYWIALSQELEFINAQSKAGPFPFLETLLKEIGTMLRHLYPDSKTLQDDMLVVWDPEFFLQQLALGNLNLVNLLSNLAMILKANCAPKRDALVDQIVILASTCDWLGMLKVLLRLIHFMKIDLVNYHLSIKRSRHLDSLIALEREYFWKNVTTGDMVLANTKQWIVTMLQQEGLQETGVVARRGFLALLDLRNTLQIPETFCFDQGRMRWLQQTCQTLCIVSSVALMIRQSTGRSLDDNQMLELKSRLHKLLTSPDSKISDIGEQTLLLCSRISGSPLIGDRRVLFLNYLDSLLNPNHRVYGVMMKKIQQLIEATLLKQVFATEDLVRMGFKGLISEVECLCKAADHLWTLHYRVHCNLYDELIASSL